MRDIGASAVKRDHYVVNLHVPYEKGNGRRTRYKRHDESQDVGSVDTDVEVYKRKRIRNSVETANEIQRCG